MNGAPRAVRHALGEPGVLGLAWRWALGITAMVATVVACLFPLAEATYSARLDRDAARFPSQIAWVQDHADDTSVPEGAVAIFAFDYDQVDYSHVEVVWLQNLDPGAPPPPGLDRWPGPRQVVASPGLLSTPDGRKFSDRHGTLVGTISDAGLVNPREKLLYAGIDPAVQVSSGTYIDGFSAERRYQEDEQGAIAESDQGYLGDVLYQWNRSSVRVALVLFAVAPCLVMIAVVVRLGGERRDQYIAWLAVIGARPAVIRRFIARESLVPTSLGCLVGLAVVGLAMTRNWSVPGIGSVIVGSFLRSAWLWCLVSAVVAAVVIQLALVVGYRVRRRSGGARPRAATGRSRPWLVLVLVAIIAVQSYLYALIYPTDPGGASTISALAAGIVIVLLAPCGGAFLAFFGTVAMRLAHRTGSPVALVTGRELAALPRPALRTGAVIAAGVVVTVQAVLLLAGPTQWESAARSAAAVDPKATAVLEGVPSDDSWLPRADAGLPPRLALIQVEYDSVDPTVVRQVRATCAQIERLGSECPTDRSSWGEVLGAQPIAAREALSFAIPLKTQVEPVAVLGSDDATSPEIAPTYVIVSADGQALDDDEVARVLGAFVSPNVVVAHPWTSEVVGATTDLTHARWILVAGAVAGVVLIITAALALWFETVRIARRMASLSMMITRRRTTDALGVGLIGLPICAAAALGVLAAVGLATMPTSVPDSEIAMPWGYFTALAAIALTLSVSAGLVAARTVRAYGTCWIPADENF